MKVLVTGGAGFIGSHIVERLAGDGHDVRVLDNYSEGKKENLEGLPGRIECWEEDIRDMAAVRNATSGVEVVYHQAAIPSVPRSFEDPVLFEQVNVMGTINVLLAARENRVRRVVQASSSSVYGDTEQLPKEESLCPRPQSPYALTKLSLEHYGEIFCRQLGLEVVSLRYFNVYGPRQSLTSGYAAVIPSFVSAALASRPLPVEGDGEQTRDFCFVTDVVEANLLAAQAPGAPGHVFNIAGGCRTSINQLANMVQRLLPEVKTSIVRRPARVGDVRHSWADISKAHRILGFTPQVSIEEGLVRTIEYFKTPG